MAESIEKEIKLVLNPEDLAALWESEWLKEKLIAGSRQTLTLVNRYYDTSEDALEQAGIAYRVRQTGESYEATVKTGKVSSGGMSAREEYTVPTADATPVLTGFSEEMDARLAALVASSTLTELFTVTVERQVALLTISTDTVVELAADSGVIRAGEKEDKVYELEIELKQGSERDLWDCVAQLAAQYPMWTEERSKYVRGLALAKGGKERTLSHFAVTSQESAGQAVYELLLYYCDRLLRTQNAILRGKSLPISYKRLLEQVKALRAMWRLGREFCPEALWRQGRDVLKEMLLPIVDFYAYQRVSEQCHKLYKGAISSKSTKKFLEKIAKQGSDLLAGFNKLLEQGFFTWKVFELRSLIEHAEIATNSTQTLAELVAEVRQSYFTKATEAAGDDLKLKVNQSARLLSAVETLNTLSKVCPLEDKEIALSLKALHKSLRILLYDVEDWRGSLNLLRTGKKPLPPSAGLLESYRLSKRAKVHSKVRRDYEKFYKEFKKLGKTKKIK